MDIDIDIGKLTEAINYKADLDLGNLSEKGKQKLKGYTAITNCLTKIPQDIKLELSNGTLTLKGGSKVYVPNGEGVFDEVVVDSDIILNSLQNRIGLLFYREGKIYTEDINRCYSGLSYSGDTFGLWYDTINKKIGYTSNGGSSFIYGNSLPLAICNITTSNVVSIDQVFNGFGYIGSTIFALPGVEGLIPDYRNEDGSLKNIKWKCENVIIYEDQYKYKRDAYFGVLDNKQSIAAYDKIITCYDEDKNVIIDTYPDPDVERYGWSLWGELSIDSTGRITSLKPKNTFQVVDRNDTEWASTQGKPSSRYEDLEVRASGSAYTAPANGGFFMTGQAEQINRNINMKNTTTNLRLYSHASWEGTLATVFMPCKKGEECIIEYDVNVKDFKFIYDEGVK